MRFRLMRLGLTMVQVNEICINTGSEDQDSD